MIKYQYFMKHLVFLLLLCLSVFSCKKEDNGPGNCPNGFTGQNCDEQVTPTNILIKSITVTNFPPTDNGAGWDLTSGPDVYITISQNGNVLYDNSSNFVQNASAGVTLNSQFVLPDVTGLYSISVFDHDDFDDDYMGGIIAQVYTSTNGFPSIVQLSCATCKVSLSLSVVYTF